MKRPEEIPGYEVPLHTALTQPVLLAGAPRTFAILNATLAMVIGLGLHLWWLGFPVGLVCHLAAMAMTKRDPDWFDVVRRHLRQPTYLDS
jgi:type IV secretion system protein VirB3